MRTFISKVNTDGTVTGAYCDGEVDGSFLIAHYSEPTKLDALIQLNDIITLAEDPSNTTSYNFEPGSEEGHSRQHVFNDTPQMLGRIIAENCVIFQDGAWTQYQLLQPGFWSIKQL